MVLFKMKMHKRQIDAKQIISTFKLYSNYNKTKF